MKKTVLVTRKTTESKIKVSIDFNGLSSDYRAKINTPMAFLSHMIEHLAYRGNFTITTELSLDKFDLGHIICEDLGITIGKAISEYIKASGIYGVMGYGDGTSIIDEAMAQSVISFESRTYFNFSKGSVEIPTRVEGMLSEDILTFLEGFCQGANCTLHIDLKKGENGHHIWEAIFRSLGVALKNALYLDEKMVGRTAGVAGNITFETEMF